MITTFFGGESFGGDAAYVDRLSRALLRAGHEVEVVHCADAFAALRGTHPLRPYEPPPGLRVHTLRSGLGRLSPLWTHQLGTPGPKRRAIRDLLGSGGFDVVHLHNVSLVGGPGLVAEVRDATDAAVLLTAHDYWLVCPKSNLWRFERAPCVLPRCATCTLHARRPVQLWRYGEGLTRSLRELDAVIVPSEASARIHRERGIDVPLEVLPYFIPSDWAGPAGPGAPQSLERPLLVAASRLVPEKGLATLIAAMHRVPDVDLVIAGVGPSGGELARLAARVGNARLVGLLGARELATLYASAAAVVMPSLWLEPFGYVVLEAASVGTPAVVRRRGALAELVEGTGGGLVYETDDELVGAIRAVVDAPELRARLAERAREAAAGAWSERGHLERYLALAREAATRRRAA